MILEICANSYQSAINAQVAGAHRIELCSELSVGGVTPSPGLLKKVMADIKIPVHVLIRPRGGNFLYTENEFEIMKETIRLCKDLHCAGIVSGVLHEDYTIDKKRTLELIELAKPLSFTFHRAFDEVTYPREALLQLITLGADRLLTSGQEEKAEDGIDLLIELQKLARNKLTILPGSGINSVNCIHFKNSGFSEIHSSASKIISKNIPSSTGESKQTVSDVETIKKILNAIT